MTVLTDRDDRQLECDACPSTTDVYDKDDFDIMVRDAREAGWAIKHEGDRWTHTCPNCKGGDRLARARRLFGQA